jgi:hypothetical protein
MVGVFVCIMPLFCGDRQGDIDLSNIDTHTLKYTERGTKGERGERERDLASSWERVLYPHRTHVSSSS